MLTTTLQPSNQPLNAGFAWPVLAPPLPAILAGSMQEQRLRRALLRTALNWPYVLNGRSWGTYGARGIRVWAGGPRAGDSGGDRRLPGRAQAVTSGAGGQARLEALDSEPPEPGVLVKFAKARAA
jgi:hypothetical protein